ncbi:MAG TPA: serine hydrolase domain-containing protein [Acidimicrobiales bacterium]|nr:serine hydrolase domain-containing protein [Acidimicrobiales bacterium]
MDDRWPDLGRLARFPEGEAAADRFSGTVVVERGGVVVFSGAYSHAHLGLGVPNDEDTRCNIASITKMITTVAVLQLVEQDALSLDAVVGDLLPDVGIGMADRMTVHHLLSHQSGLGDYWTDRCRERRSVLRTTDDYLALVEGMEPAFAPGTSTAYGSSGFVLLGAIVERTSGTDYYEHVRTHVCRRAGMDRADHLHLDQITDFAHGYTYVEWEGPLHADHRTDNIFQYPVRGSAATAMYSSAPELLKFGQALRAGELVGERFVHSMLQPRALGGEGYGTQEVPYARGIAVGHGGRAFGAATLLLFLPEVDASVCVLSNFDRPADKGVFAELDAMLVVETQDPVT